LNKVELQLTSIIIFNMKCTWCRCKTRWCSCNAHEDIRKTCKYLLL